MIYFDTDVLIHLLLPQDLVKHEHAHRLYWDSTEKEELFISLLCLQETGFVLQKLAQQPDVIEKMLDSFMHYQPVA